MSLESLSIRGGLELNDGSKMPKMGFGTFDLGDETEEAVNCSIESGFRLIDCARFYGNEKSVGRALAQTPVAREELFITSKVWNDRQIDGTVRESVEETLDDLGIDQLDLLLIHWPVEGHFIDTWKLFEKMKEEGLVRSIGVSNFQQAHLERLMRKSDTIPVVNQLERHPYLQDDDTLGFCKCHQIVLEAWSPLGRGLCLEDETILSIARSHNASAAQVILAWQVQSGVVPVPRSKSPERIRQNADALSITLSEEEMRQIDALDKHAPVIEGIDPENFAEHLNSLSSHF